MRFWPPTSDEVLLQLKCFPSLRLYFASSKIPCHLACSMVRKKWNAPDFKWWESLDKTSENIVSLLILLVLTGGTVVHRILSFEAFCEQAHPTCKGSSVSSSSENVNEHSFARDCRLQTAAERGIKPKRPTMVSVNYSGIGAVWHGVLTAALSSTHNAQIGLVSDLARNTKQLQPQQ